MEKKYVERKIKKTKREREREMSGKDRWSLK